EVHPLAATYPPMNKEELEALAADIKARGLLRPILLYEGMILDGRNRYAACELAGVEPRSVEYEGDDPLRDVNSLNLTRAWTGAQRAIVAARQWGLGDHSKGGRPAKNKPLTLLEVSLPKLAKQFRVGQQYIIQANGLLGEAPDLGAKVEACTLSLAAAHAQLAERKKQAAQQQRNAERVAEYREAIS